jgi:putative transposase
MVGYTKRKELAEGLRGLFAAPSREVALRLASELAARWRGSHPKVAEHPEEHIEGASLACDLPRVPPPAHPHHQWPGEAQPGDIKRRSRVVRIFPNRQACLRLVSALAVEHSEEWVPGRRYLDMRELEEYRRQEEREAEEARRMER